jgi:hypothetical protein
VVLGDDLLGHQPGGSRAGARGRGLGLGGPLALQEIKRHVVLPGVSEVDRPTS